MRALHLAGGSLRLREDHPDPEPGPGEALVRVSLAGICSTDLELVCGYYPFTGILGHEFVGLVEECGDAPEWIGRRVVGTINLSPDCGGRCGRRCPEHCPDRTVLGIVGKDGVFADRVTLPAANLLAVPDSLPDQAAVFTEPLAAALRIPEQIPVAGLETLVVGPGRLGLLCAQALRHEGARVTVLGRSAKSLELPRDLGFPVLRSDRDPEPLPRAPLVIECTANPSGLERAVDLCQPQGTIVLKSTYADPPGENNPFARFAPVLAKAVVNEIQVLGLPMRPLRPGPGTPGGRVPRNRPDGGSHLSARQRPGSHGPRRPPRRAQGAPASLKQTGAVSLPAVP